MRHVTVWLGRTIQVYITHAVCVAGIDGTRDVPTVQRVETDGETHAEVRVPVAVDVLRSRDAATRRLIIGHDIADAVAGNLQSGIGVETPVALILGHLESQTVGDDFGLAHHLKIGVEVAVEGGLQSRITHRDVQGVGIVVDFKQLRDTGLLRLSAELHLQVGLLIEAIAQVEGRRDIGHRAHGINGIAQILLDEM